jgi:hypothetical protein
MPYIKQEDRYFWNQLVADIVQRIEREDSVDGYDKAIILYGFIYSGASKVAYYSEDKRYKFFEKAYGMLNCMYREFLSRCKHLFHIIAFSQEVSLQDISHDWVLKSSRFLFPIDTVRADIPYEDLGGQINYTISALINLLLEKEIFTANEIRTVIEQVMFDFYKYEIVEYEKLARDKNGEVYHV